MVERNRRQRYNNVPGAVNHGNVQNRPTNITQDLTNIQTINYIYHLHSYMPK